MKVPALVITQTSILFFYKNNNIAKIWSKRQISFSCCNVTIEYTVALLSFSLFTIYMINTCILQVPYVLNRLSRSRAYPSREWESLVISYYWNIFVFLCSCQVRLGTKHNQNYFNKTKHILNGPSKSGGSHGTVHGICAL